MRSNEMRSDEMRLGTNRGSDFWDKGWSHVHDGKIVGHKELEVITSRSSDVIVIVIDVVWDCTEESLQLRTRSNQTASLRLAIRTTLYSALK